MEGLYIEFLMKIELQRLYDVSDGTAFIGVADTVLAREHKQELEFLKRVRDGKYYCLLVILGAFWLMLNYFRVRKAAKQICDNATLKS